MALTDTIWPTDLVAPPAVQQWLSDFYATVDSKTEDSGIKLAALFTDNGTMHGMSGRVTGKEAIAASRSDAWKVIASRKHVVLHVFTASKTFSSILIIGNLIASLHNGNEVNTEFIAQIEFNGWEEGKSRAALYKVWGDSAPWINAMSS